MPVAIARPKLEGNIAVGDDRQIGFAEFGDPQGRAIFWLHGTPGARRQIPMEARVYAEQRQLRLIGVDRPGIGSSTPYQYDPVFAFAEDLREGGVAGLSVRDMRQYLEFVADQRLTTLGLAKGYGAKNPFAFMDLQDVRMVEPSHRLGFQLKACQPFGSGGNRGPNHFERDETLQARLPRLVDHAHAAVS